MPEELEKNLIIALTGQGELTMPLSKIKKKYPKFYALYITRLNTETDRRKILERMKRYYKRNLQNIADKRKTYYNKNKENILEKAKKKRKERKIKKENS